MKSGTTNALKTELMLTMRKTKKAGWLRVADMLGRPHRKGVSVNLWKISKLSQDGDIVVVPGKVLGAGELTRKVHVAAFAFAASAAKKLGKSAMTLEEAVKKNPKGTGIRIIQ